MKILNYINNLGSGGAEKLITDVLPLQKKQGHDVAVMISNSEANVEGFVNLLKEHQIPIVNLNMSFYNPLQVIRIVHIIRKEHYDIVHAHLFPTQYWLAIASLFIPRKTKLVKTEHANFNERRKFSILRPLEQWKYGRYNGIIAITSSVKNNLSSWLKTSKNCVVIENGVNLDQIRKKQLNFDSANYEFLKKEHFNLLMVARIDDNQKDHIACLEALQILNDKRIHFYFAGKGPAEELVKNKAMELDLTDNVHFLGVRTDVYVLMSLVDLNVLSTNFEGLSGVTLEAMASGKGFIGSDVEGVNDVVPDASFLFSPKNPQSLAEKIQLLMENSELRLEMSKTALDHVKQYDIKVMANAYLELYTKLLKNDRASI